MIRLYTAYRKGLPRMLRVANPAVGYFSRLLNSASWIDEAYLVLSIHKLMEREE